MRGVGAIGVGGSGGRGLGGLLFLSCALVLGPSCGKASGLDELRACSTMPAPICSNMSEAPRLGINAPKCINFNPGLRTTAWTRCRR